MKIDELTRLAFVWAEQDRSSLADCWPKGSKERRIAASEANQLRKYRLKRWGKTKMDVVMDNAKPITLQELHRQTNAPAK